MGIHGWKGNRNSFKPIVDLLNIDGCKWYFPQAPYKIGDGEFTWAEQIKDGVYKTKKSTEYLINFFNDEIYPMHAPEDIHVIGFSQGATICYEFVLKMPVSMAGVYPVAGFLRNFYSTQPRIHPNQKDTPIFIGHGIHDQIVSVENSKKIYTILKKETKMVDLLLYNGGHKISMKYLEKVRKRILKK